MKINRKLLYVLLIASLAPPLFFRVRGWLNGDFQTIYDFFEALVLYSLISLVVTLSISWVVLSILHWLNQKAPWSENLLKRLVAELGLTLLASSALSLVFATLTFLFIQRGASPYNEVVFNYLTISVIMNFVLVAISDWFYFFERWKASLLENQKALTDNETLQKEKISAQYEALKNQVNPHFLFNSLNVMSSLVHSDAEKAEEFIDEFSNLYRYILEHSEDSTIDLQDEISISRSYAYLQEIRFGQAVKFSFIGFEKYQHTSKVQVLPLSIQTILENAVKHNKVAEESPLHIEIILNIDQVVVKNNLQLREDMVASTGIGTRNLMLRYKAFGLVPKFEKTADQYIATLPLIHDMQDSVESKDHNH